MVVARPRRGQAQGVGAAIRGVHSTSGDTTTALSRRGVQKRNDTNKNKPITRYTIILIYIGLPPLPPIYIGYRLCRRLEQLTRILLSVVLSGLVVFARVWCVPCAFWGAFCMLLARGAACVVARAGRPSGLRACVSPGCFWLVLIWRAPRVCCAPWQCHGCDLVRLPWLRAPPLLVVACVWSVCVVVFCTLRLLLCPVGFRLRRGYSGKFGSWGWCINPVWASLCRKG